ncbi:MULTISPECIES: hypothetical protein [unclassified Enterococcus]|uniref:hypothetical protein n=1 Tax=unclassified Enterococcus TaxID=2608891 RepID=UPI0028FD0838|nr:MULTISPECIES: hypothetical protein [unclassified Enterococcus]MDU0319002.1 hypothetical protein [Enterococcus sp. 2STP]MDU0334486.1 hypothetical protein [Enterococcus sp. 2CBP]MDU0350261.1 hypothetical protein [Enterococcus sp. 3MOLP]
MENFVLILFVVFFISFIVGLVWLITSFLKKKPKKKSLITLGISLASFVLMIITTQVAASNQAKELKETEYTDDSTFNSYYDSLVAKASSEINSKENSGNTTDSSTELSSEDTSTVSSNEEKHTEFKTGNYKIGEKMPAGEYKLTSDGSIAYYKISSDPNGEEIITNGTFNTFGYLSVQDGQYLTLQDIVATPISEVSPYTGDYKQGTYKVGFDIKAGEYELKADSNDAYVKISTDANGEDIVSNDTFTNNKFIQITDGQYLTLQACEIIQ